MRIQLYSINVKSTDKNRSHPVVNMLVHNFVLLRIEFSKHDMFSIGNHGFCLVQSCLRSGCQWPPKVLSEIVLTRRDSSGLPVIVDVNCDHDEMRPTCIAC